MSQIYVYVSGPLFCHGTAAVDVNPITNVRRALEVAEELKAYGLVPYVPHLTLFWAAMMGEQPREYWLALDKAWLARCDYLVRLPGESLGSDEEVAEANWLGIPTYCLDPGSITDFVNRYIYVVGVGGHHIG